MPDHWVIVPQGQRLSTELSPSGMGFRDVWEVTYEVIDGPAKGTHGMVRIPTDLYSAESVKEAVDAAVGSLNDVAGL